MTYLFTIYDFRRTITKINLFKKMGWFYYFFFRSNPKRRLIKEINAPTENTTKTIWNKRLDIKPTCTICRQKIVWSDLRKNNEYI